jgi:hypothetical protein
MLWFGYCAIYNPSFLFHQDTCFQSFRVGKIKNKKIFFKLFTKQFSNKAGIVSGTINILNIDCEHTYTTYTTYKTRNTKQTNKKKTKEQLKFSFVLLQTV